MISFHRRHIRTRLALWFTSVLAAVVLLYTAAACFLLLRDLRSQLVRYAIQDLETVEGLLSFAPDGRLQFRDDYHNHPESRRVLERLLEVRTPQGQLLFRNDLLRGRTLGDEVLPHEGEGGYSERGFMLPDGSRVQLVSRRHSIDGHPTIIRVAYSEAPLWAQFRSNLTALIFPLPLILLVTGLGGYLLAGRSLRPIQELARKAEQIRSDRLHERLPVVESDGEVADLSRVFNSMLVRLEQSFEQLRRFTSDASHELRTPLAAIRSVGEVGLQKSLTAAGYQDVIGSMLEEANRLTRLVDSLLTIARADAGQIQLDAASLSSVELVRECGSLLEVLLEEKKQELRFEISADPVIYGDRILLRQALVNIVHNAIKHTPVNGWITVRVLSDVEQHSIIEIEDSGPGVPAQELSKLFDRFYRVEEGRSRDSGGTGLGLAIARWNVEAHAGAITAATVPGSGCLFRILLPAVFDPGQSRAGLADMAEKNSTSVVPPHPTESTRALQARR